ncbi:ABC transporter ATP-binding protein [Roseomonas sp. OT10]|uniref:dipeptide ABC transporter ATP-binding protein n=1 Tax=Roseomonas cutis TaxID=2897332 RepID=UPI001E5722AD|nr:ABC transporter ATP-binding protein [Roseomonas sp. OT10]UFN48933.1 ABC transporter ATP-binding protein [Roseomonas sp. OT10]
MSGPPVLEVRDLSLSLGGRALVRDVSFAVAPGETVCLVGESGSGKSLLSLATMGLLPEPIRVSGGTIRLNGQEVTALGETALEGLRGREAGMVFQEPLSALNPVMRVGEQIREVFATHGVAADAARIAELLRRVGFRDPERIARGYPHRLSGGQRQRVMIAMAVALRPRLVIADEPTTALDVTTQSQILDLLRDIRREQGSGLLFVTHDFGVVGEIADRVVVLRAGEVVEQGPAAEVLGAPRADYTRALLAAVPRGEPRPRRALDAIPAIELAGARKTYHHRAGLLAPRQALVALGDVSLTVQRGETLGVIGESGSGKSTLAKLLVGLVLPEAGTLRIGGTDALARGARRGLYRQVQMVFQDPYASLNPRRRVLDILVEAPLAAGIPAAVAREEALAMLHRVGLPEDAARRFPHEFSGGQRQRIAIARALAVRPAVLVADEPVSALDVSVQRQILELLRGIQAELGLTMVFITHDLRVAAELCDRLAIMREGKVVEYGWTGEVMRRPRDAYTRRLLASIPGRAAA